MRRIRLQVMLLFSLITTLSYQPSAAQVTDEDKRRIDLDAPLRAVEYELGAITTSPEPVISGYTDRAAYTWVINSSQDKTSALSAVSKFQRFGLACDIIEAVVKGRMVYRVTTGLYATEAEAYAARKRLPSQVPLDIWLLALRTEDVKRSLNQMSRESVSHPPQEVPAAKAVPTPPAQPGPAAIIPGESEEKLTIREIPELPAAGASDEGSAQEEDTHSENEQRPQLRQILPGLLDVQTFTTFSNDSNINHEQIPKGAFGNVMGFRAFVQSSVSDPILTASAVVGRHAYTNTSSWDRVSQLYNLNFEPDMSGRIRLATEAELSLKGSSEDHDLSNQYQIRQGVEYRITRQDRLQLWGTYRQKFFEGSPESNAFKPNVEARFEKRMPENRRYEMGIRYETNRTKQERDTYARWTFDMEYRTSVLGSRDLLKLEAKYRRKSYQNRYIEIEDDDFLRNDFQWLLNASWEWRFNRQTSCTLNYSLETRDSNDPEKIFAAHLLTVSVWYLLF